MWVPLAVAGYFWIRGHSRSSDTFLGLNLLLPILLLTWGASLAFGANAALDFAPPVTRTVKVRTSSKDQVWVESWRPDGKELSVSVDREFHQTVPDGTSIELETSPGALGWEWVRAIHFR